jgi:uncharacterized membrane protein YvbJ
LIRAEPISQTKEIVMDNVTTENKKAVKKNILILIAVAAVLLICVFAYTSI